MGGFSFPTRFYNKISHKDKIKWLVETQEKAANFSGQLTLTVTILQKSDILTYFSVALNGQKLPGFYPETYATSFPGLSSYPPGCGKMRDPENEVETYGSNSLQHFLALIL